MVDLAYVGTMLNQKARECHVSPLHSVDERAPAVASAGHVSRCPSVEEQQRKIEVFAFAVSICDFANLS